MSSSELSGMLNEMLGSRLTMDKFQLRLQLGWSIFIAFFLPGLMTYFDLILIFLELFLSEAMVG